VSTGFISYFVHHFHDAPGASDRAKLADSRPVGSWRVAPLAPTRPAWAAYLYGAVVKNGEEAAVTGDEDVVKPGH